MQLLLHLLLCTQVLILWCLALHTFTHFSWVPAQKQFWSTISSRMSWALLPLLLFLLLAVVLLLPFFVLLLLLLVLPVMFTLRIPPSLRHPLPPAPHRQPPLCPQQHLLPPLRYLRCRCPLRCSPHCVPSISIVLPHVSVSIVPRDFGGEPCRGSLFSVPQLPFVYQVLL